MVIGRPGIYCQRVCLGEKRKFCDAILTQLREPAAFAFCICDALPKLSGSRIPPVPGLANETGNAARAVFAARQLAENKDQELEEKCLDVSVDQSAT